MKQYIQIEAQAEHFESTENLVGVGYVNLGWDAAPEVCMRIAPDLARGSVASRQQFAVRLIPL